MKYDGVSALPSRHLKATLLATFHSSIPSGCETLTVQSRNPAIRNCYMIGGTTMRYRWNIDDTDTAVGLF